MIPKIFCHLELDNNGLYIRYRNSRENYEMIFISRTAETVYSTIILTALNIGSLNLKSS